jgi:hypothetical protein
MCRVPFFSLRNGSARCVVHFCLRKLLFTVAIVAIAIPAMAQEPASTLKKSWTD